MQRIQNQQNQQNQYAQLGAHEVMEVHEVLTKSINGINTVQLIANQIKDPQLRTVVNNQFQFMVQEYNSLVQALNQRTGQTGAQAMNQQRNYQQGMNQNISMYHSHTNYTPAYGLNNPATNSPISSATELQDQDIASIILGIHKASAAAKAIASLECADPQLRRMILQGVVNCNEQAYEVWQYMNQKGFYQVPTLKQTTTDTFINTFSTANNTNLGQIDMTMTNHHHAGQYQ